MKKEPSFYPIKTCITSWKINAHVVKFLPLPLSKRKNIKFLFAGNKRLIQTIVECLVNRKWAPVDSKETILNNNHEKKIWELIIIGSSHLFFLLLEGEEGEEEEEGIGKRTNTFCNTILNSRSSLYVCRSFSLLEFISSSSCSCSESCI